MTVKPKVEAARLLGPNQPIIKTSVVPTPICPSWVKISGPASAKVARSSLTQGASGRSRSGGEEMTDVMTRSLADGNRRKPRSSDCRDRGENGQRWRGGLGARPYARILRRLTSLAPKAVSAVVTMSAAVSPAFCHCASGLS